ncbi:MAG TPA: hypothetical protein VID24_01530 [Candidatus Eremiobacteraceae bacterium]|jgi:hypothetical protein
MKNASIANLLHDVAELNRRDTVAASVSAMAETMVNEKIAMEAR